MKLSEFKFNLPDGLIAVHPTENRDDARMMVVHRSCGKIEHKVFKDITEYFDEGDAMVVNDTMVFPARMFGKKEKTGANIELFLLRELVKEEHLWDAVVEPARKIRVGNKLFFGECGLIAEVVDNTTSRGRTIKFLYDGADEELNNIIYSLGETPIPKYLNRSAEAEDIDRYQTVYAKNIGAVAAPSAGFHFTPEVLKRLELNGVDVVPLTLHVGLGTFRQINVEDLTKYKTESESFNVPEATSKIVNHALDSKKKVCAVGATTLRAMESSVSANGRLKPSKGWTDKFIFPPYGFRIPNALITNFQMPCSSLLMSTCAFGGYNLIMKAYDVAVNERYHFLDYGDVMLVL